MKEVIHPASKIINSLAVKAKPKLSIFRRLAPNITGMDIKNENSAATGLEAPISIPAMMVDPERDVPGMSAKIWNKPTKKACLYPKEFQS